MTCAVIDELSEERSSDIANRAQASDRLHALDVSVLGTLKIYMYMNLFVKDITERQIWQDANQVYING